MLAFPYRIGLAVTFVCAAAAPLYADASAELTALTKAHVRVVWVQDQSSQSNDTLALGRELKLMGFDNRDRRGERALLGDIQNYAKPLLTPDGDRVVFSDRYSKEFFVVNWDGTGKRRIGLGYAIEVWKDPATGKTWVYTCKQTGKLHNINLKSLRRIPLDGSSGGEPIWDKTEISPDNFQLSADGTFAACEFPWPNGGTLDLVSMTTRKRADGCWASLAPDSSGLCWVFDGPHRSVYMYPRNASSSWKVDINTAPEIGTFEVFHPRWSNHVRYLCVTGPYKVKTSVNYIVGGGPEVEVHVGRFSEDFRSVEAWTRVTKNLRGDFHPDVWVESGETSSIPSDVLKISDQETAVIDQWPGSKAGLIFVWDNAAAQNMIAGQDESSSKNCRVEAHGKAKYGRFFDMDCAGGWFVAEPAGRELIDACQASGELTIEAVITPGSDAQSGPVRVISVAPNAGRGAFVLSQHQDTLHFGLNTNQAGPNPVTTRLGKVKAEQLGHWVLTYASGKLVCYLDGKPVVISDKVRGDFSNWTDQPLTFGADATGKHHWLGRLEGIAIFNRALSAEEIAKDYELFSSRLDHRTPLERMRVRAVCVEASEIPDPRTIVPYRRALIVNRYRVEKVIEGTLEPREILVAQWGILDKTVVKESKTRTGQAVELTLENFEDHPELNSERQIVDVEGLELPWFYAVGK